MKIPRTIAFALSLLFVVALTAQTRGVVNNAIPGDNNMRCYRLVLPVTVSAFQQDLNSDYNNVLRFWQECEEFANRIFVPLGICFDVVEDSRLVMSQSNMIDLNIYNVTSFGTELTNEAVGSATYDVGMWIHHRSEFDENTGLSVGNGVYNSLTKSSGYAKTDKWVVAHELGHMFGADFHTSQGEGSLMDNEGEFFSYPSILLIREESVKHGVSGAYTYKSVTNSAPVFDVAVMKDVYRIPQGACMAIPVSATDEHVVTYSAIGCGSANIRDVNGEDGMLPHFSSLPPQRTAVIDYSPKYRADIYDEEFYFVTSGTDVPSMSAGSYPIAFLANDVPANTSYGYLMANPFYSNYSVWDATVQIIGGTAFKALLTPQKNNYSAGETVTVKWGVNNNYFTKDSRVRITMSTNYGKTFDYVLAESVSATDGSCEVNLPNVNVGSVDVDFVTATRSMRGGIIRVEEIGGVAYTLTTLAPENGGGFTVSGGGTAPEPTVIYSVTAVAEPANGGVVAVNGKGTSAAVEEKSQVTLSATPNSGYIFDGWYYNATCVSTSAEYSVVVTADAGYVARFEKIVLPEEPDKPEVSEGDILYKVVDEAGNVYSGAYIGNAGKDRPTFSGAYGYELVNEKWNGSSYEATIKFPFMVSKVGELPNEILISNFAEKSKLWHAAGNDVKVQANNNDYPIDINCLWAIYPLFEKERFAFVIKSVANGRYVYSDAVDNTNAHNKQGTVVLSDKPSEFEYVQSGGKEGFKFVGKQNLYLSINSVNDKNVYLGVYSNPHNGTKIYDSVPISYGVPVNEMGYATFYAAVPVAVPEGVEVYYIAENCIGADYVVLTEMKENVIPAGVGVVIKAEKDGVYNFDITDAPSYEIKSLFKGSVAAEYITEDVYILAERSGVAGLGKDSAFINNGHGVYLPISAMMQENGFGVFLRFDFSGTTAVESADLVIQTVGTVYDLQGREIKDITSSGIYIVNGKKIMKR